MVAGAGVVVEIVVDVEEVFNVVLVVELTVVVVGFLAVDLREYTFMNPFPPHFEFGSPAHTPVQLESAVSLEGSSVFPQKH